MRIADGTHISDTTTSRIKYQMAALINDDIVLIFHLTFESSQKPFVWTRLSEKRVHQIILLVLFLYTGPSFFLVFYLFLCHDR